MCGALGGAQSSLVWLQNHLVAKHHPEPQPGPAKATSTTKTNDIAGMFAAFKQRPKPKVPSFHINSRSFAC
jgi:hypothetical protein